MRGGAALGEVEAGSLAGKRKRSERQDDAGDELVEYLLDKLEDSAVGYCPVEAVPGDKEAPLRVEGGRVYDAFAD